MSKFKVGDKVKVTVGWGANDFNQSAVPSGLSTAVQVSAGTFHSVALKSDGTVVAWGRNDQGQRLGVDHRQS